MYLNDRFSDLHQSRGAAGHALPDICQRVTGKEEVTWDFYARTSFMIRISLVSSGSTPGNLFYDTEISAHPPLASELGTHVRAQAPVQVMRHAPSQVISTHLAR